ncbi:MAG: 2-hydroxyacid dehydrogenase [Alphaproteobacteria bacterium]|nr:2-hydroxyacid dehydrogenase [Alphaproteobacteria bacterium]
MQPSGTRPQILQIGSLPHADQADLDERFTVHRYWEAHNKAAFLAQHGPRVRGIATRGALGADATILNACPALEIVSVYGVGYDAVDITLCKDRGIRVTNTPDVLTEDVADLALGMMLALMRGIVPADAWVRSGNWAARGPFSLQTRVWGKRAGILGLGRIGMAVAARCQGFGMALAYCDPVARPDIKAERLADPVALAQASDVLFVTLAASDETAGIVDDKVLQALGPAGYLVNVSRAANVDEAALLGALESRGIAGAALDVFAGEPTIDARFGKLDNVVLQPHHASGTHETRAAMGALMRANLIAHFQGDPLPSAVL